MTVQYDYGTDPEPLDDATRHRPAPSVLAAERAAVGVAMWSAALTDTVAETLTPADFYDPELAVVFQAAMELSGSGKPVDPLTVQHHLTVTGQMSLLRRSGPQLPGDLMAQATVPEARYAEYVADIVANDARRRHLRQALSSAEQYAGTPEFEWADADRIVAQISQAATYGRRTEGAAWAGDDLDDTLADLEKDGENHAIPTPWADMNAGVSMQPGQLVVIAGRPGNGKSIVGLNMAAHVALRCGEGAYVASLEMSRKLMHRRLLAAEAKVNLHHLEHKKLDDADWSAIGRVIPVLHQAPLLIDAGAGLTTARIRSRIRYMRTRVPTRLVVVDYLQLMRGTGRYERRDLELADITGGLKAIATDLDVCVVALSQVSRAVDTRTDRRATLGDLRESGAIEQDADTVIFLNRPDSDGPDKRSGEFDMVVAKQRSGPSGFTITTAWQGHYARIVDMGGQR